MSRLAPWATAAVLLGVVTGFAFGTAGEDDGSPSARSTTSTLSARGGASTSRGGAAPPVGLVCVGDIGDQPDFYKVAGVLEAGAHELAQQLGTLESSARLAQLDGDDAAHALRNGVLADAQHGPILLAVRLTDGTRQRTLAQDLIEASPRSVVVIVQPSGPPDPDSKLGYPERSIVVTPSAGSDDADFAAPWAERVASVAQGRSSCSPPGG